MAALNFKSKNNVLRNIMGDNISRNNEDEEIPGNKETKAFSNVSKLKTYDTYDSSYDQPKDFTETIKESEPANPERKDTNQDFNKKFSTPKNDTYEFKEGAKNIFTSAKNIIKGNKSGLESYGEGDKRKQYKEDILSTSGSIEFPESPKKQLGFKTVTREERRAELDKTLNFIGKWGSKGGKAIGVGTLGAAKWLAGRDPQNEQATERLLQSKKTIEHTYNGEVLELKKKYGVDTMAELNLKLTGEQKNRLEGLQKEKDIVTFLYEDHRKQLPRVQNTRLTEFATNVGGNLGSNIGGFMGSFTDKNASQQARYANMAFQKQKAEYMKKKGVSNEAELLSQLTSGQLKNYMASKQKAMQTTNIAKGAGFMGAGYGGSIIRQESTRQPNFKEFTEVGRSGPPELGMFNPETIGRFNVNQGLRATNQNKIASILGKGPDTGISSRDKLRNLLKR